MQKLGGRAAVLGAGLAGLFTARVLSEAYDQVTLIERDVLPPPGPCHGPRGPDAGVADGLWLSPAA